jgi:uncharacterized protein
MKYLMVLGVVLFGIWLWRHNRAAEARERRATRPTPAPPGNPPPRSPTQMVACTHCGLHLPLAEAVAGTRGHYCTHAHHRAHED